MVREVGGAGATFFGLAMVFPASWTVLFGNEDPTWDHDETFVEARRADSILQVLVRFFDRIELIAIGFGTIRVVLRSEALEREANLFWSSVGRYTKDFVMGAHDVFLDE